MAPEAPAAAHIEFPPESLTDVKPDVACYRNRRTFAEGDSLRAFGPFLLALIGSQLRRMGV
jgi:hypothetical protein